MKIVEIILVNFKVSNLLIGVQVSSGIHFLEVLIYHPKWNVPIIANDSFQNDEMAIMESIINTLLMNSLQKNRPLDLVIHFKSHYTNYYSITLN